MLSAEDAVPVKHLTGVDELASTKLMSDEWTRGLISGERTIIYPPFVSAEGNTQCRGELISANADDLA